MFQADELLLALRRADVRFIIIGGIAVGVHGYVRATKDLPGSSRRERTSGWRRAAGRQKDLVDLRELSGG
jgi:hypothetical protein